MAYTYTLNYAATDVHAGTYNMITLLVASGWTIEGSGGGTGGSYSAVGNILTGSIYGSSVIDKFGTRYGWLRIASPDGHEFLFQNFQHGIDDWTVQYSRSDGFTGSLDGAPSEVIAPTANDACLIVGYDMATQNGSAWFAALDATTQKWDYVIGGADEEYAFYALGRRSPEGNYRTGLLFDRLTDTPPDSLDNVVVMAPGNGNNGAADRTIFYDTSPRDNRNRTLAKRETGYTTPPTEGGPWTWARDPASEIAMSAAKLYALYTPGYLNIESDAAANVYGGDYDVRMGVDWYTSRYATFSGGGGGYSQIVPTGAYKGRSRLLVGRSGPFANDMDTDVGETMVYQFTTGVFGAFWLRWDGATTPIL